LSDQYWCCSGVNGSSRCAATAGADAIDAIEIDMPKPATAHDQTPRRTRDMDINAPPPFRVGTTEPTATIIAPGLQKATETFHDSP
jgi:hypothetical protein